MESDEVKICRMILRKKEEEYFGEHPFGGTVRFYAIKSTNKMSKKVSEVWFWSYNNAHSSSLDSLEDAVYNWRETIGLSIR